MGKIESIKFSQARISFENFCVRLSLKYKGVYCSKIKIWKLPKSGNILSLLNSKSLYLAVYGDSAKFLQGWFYQDDLINALASKIAECSNEADLKKLSLDLKNIIANETPSDSDKN